MAILTRGTRISIDANSAEMVVSGLTAGSAILAGAPCYIASDSKVYMSSGSGTYGEAPYVGFSYKAFAPGDICSLYRGRFCYGSSLTPGVPLFLTAGSPGYLQTDPRTFSYSTTGSHMANPVAWVVSSTDIIAK